MTQEQHVSISAPVHLSPPSIERGDIVIIGNGIAGLSAAIEARRLAPEKSIILVTDQAYPTINTPALKQFASGKLQPEQLLAFPPGVERVNDIYVAHEHVEQIDAQSRAIGFSGNRWFGYRSLVLATGSRPNLPPADLPGRDIDGVLTLHRLEDYRAMRRRIHNDGARQAVVVGGGVHAAETVMALRKWGIGVHWLMRGETFLSKTLDRPASTMVIEHMRSQGVCVETRTEVAGVVGRLGTVATVLTSSHHLIPCQLVCFCTGTTANTALAQACSTSFALSQGIIVDDLLRTSVPDISAIGDVAALKNPQTGAYESRALWFAAILQAKMVAAVLTGNAERLPRFGAHWHATQIGHLSMLTVGDPLHESRTREILVDTRNGYRRLAFEHGRLVGYLSLGHAQPDGLALKRIIDEALPVTTMKADLLQPDFDARAYLATRKSRQVVLMHQPTAQLRLPARENPGPLAAALN